MDALVLERRSTPLSETAGPVLILPQGAPADLAEVLRRASEAAAPGCVVQVARDGTETTLDAAAVREHAERILGGLRARGARPGDEMILLTETADEFVPALWACLVGGFTAVPVGAVGDQAGGQAAATLREVWRTLDGPLVLAGDGAENPARSVLGAGARVAPLAELAANAPEAEWRAAAPDDVAVLLPSSGTTGRPKLIQRTHRNLLRVCQSSPAVAGYDGPPLTFLRWLPIGHNAGLNSTLILLAAGARQIHMATRDVLDEPERWLDALHRYRVSRTGATNYLLGLVNSRLDEIGDGAWDLSCVESVGVTAEPVIVRTVRGFLRRMEPYGLRPDVIRPAYGMSEVGAIAGITDLRLDERGDGEAFVEAGRPYPGIAIRVVEAGGAVVPEGSTGRIQVRGETVTPGYARDPELTRASFTADGWFDTGDAGFLCDGVLTITGREKDVLIVNGLNVHSQALESAVEEVEGVERGCTAVSAVRLPGRDTDAAAVFLHTPLARAGERSALRREVRRVAAARFGVTAARVLLLERGEIPRTATGKIRRGELRRRLEAGELAAAVAEDADSGGGEAYAPPRSALERAICAVWAEALGVDRVGIHDDFLGLGGHSLLAGRVAARVRAVSGAEVPLRFLFEYPTVAGLAAAVEALGSEPAVAAPEPTAAAEGPLPLSFAQQRLWFIDRLEPGGSAYNLARALRFTGPLDVASLERALGEIVRRHETLRTTFAEVDGSPVQVPAPFAGFSLSVQDLSSLDPHTREAEATRRAGLAAAAPFDLERGPLFRAGLLRLGADEHVLLLALHHIAGDGWSIAVLYREIEALYAAFSRNEPSPLAPLPLRYIEHAVRERAELAGEALERQLSWWRRQLAGTPALLNLPTDRPRTGSQSHRGAVTRFSLPAGLGARLAAIGRAEGATPFMTLLSAFQVLLSRYSGQEDVVVGTPVAARSRPELEGLIGFFANTLALRTDLSGDPTFRQLLRRVREATLGAYAHQDLPFEKLVEELQPERSLGYAPLFQVTFALQNAAGAPPRLPGIQTASLRVDDDVALFDLGLDLAEQGGELRGRLEYATDLFDAATAERLIGHLRTLLEGIASAPDTRLSALEMLGSGERRLLLEDWNATARAFPRDRCLHDLIADTARRFPQSPAVVFEGGTLSYARLDARANRLARHLRRLGAGPETRVAISMHRGPDVAVAVLGVLKAGAAYVPIDPEYPPDRLAYMLEDCGAAVLLTERALVTRLPDSGAAIVRLDADREQIAAESAEPLERGVTPASLAYVVYTSGSTGRAKGVAVSHRAVVNYAVDIAPRWGMREDDRVLQFASLSFDVVVEELFPTWISGGAVVFSSRDLFSPPELERAVSEHGVTWLELPTAYWHEWAADLARRGAVPPASLRFLVVGGERVQPERLAEWAGTGVPLVHVFGLTETACTSASLRLEAGDDGARWPNLPVGTPTGNVRFYVVDGTGRPVPLGVAGELFIGGEGVARGYLNRPALTAERFVPDPYSGDAGARLYRTGDRVRWLVDGMLEFLGRIDHQVKIRGFRVETGEVEAALTAVSGVRDAFVMAREDVAGDRRLVAYVVADVGPAEIRAALAAELPDYMIPTAFVYLVAIPLTPNGKVNRRALPAPEYAGAEERYVPPRNPVEEVMAGVWAEVLRLDRAGVTDNFFELGGHSLLATRVVSRIRDALGVELPLRTLFEEPTVAGLAERVEELRRAALAVLPPVTPVERDGPLPLSFAQERLWFLDRLQPGSAFYNVPTALRLSGPLDVPALERALGDLVRRHETLRTTYAEGETGPAQVVAPFAGFTLPVEAVPGADEDGRGAEARRLAAEEAARPFDLAAGPVFRPRLLRLDADEHVLLLSMHHIASDAWSVGVLFRELSALYAAHLEGAPSPLPELPVQYADYAAWQRRALRGETLDAQLAYWRARLDGAPALLELPTDRPRPAVQTYRGAHARIAFPPQLLERLQRLARPGGATLHMVLLAAFQVLLSKYARTDDVVVGSPVAGRTRREVEELIGFFVNTLVIRTDLSGDPSFRETLRRVRDAALGAYEHQEVPFEKLVAELQPDRSLSHSPLFQVMFTLDDADLPDGSLAGVRVQGAGAGSGTTQFDLTLVLRAGPSGLRGTLGYSTDLFEAATVERLVGHLRVLLEAAADDPERRLSRLPLLDEVERGRVLALAGGATEWPASGALHHRFEARAAARPDAPAVSYEDETLTYGELNARANRLARRLRALGVAPESRVGLCVERSLDLVVGVLGVLKAGGAYVPLDPAYPAERLAYMAADAGIRVLVTQQPLRDRVPAEGIEIVALDAVPADELPDDLDVAVSPGNLAYVIYTSGSTGRPKGVGVTHGNVLRLFDCTDTSFRFGADDVWTLFHSSSFDFSVWEIWGRSSAAAGWWSSRGR
jgi:amino acid adenylation domain-containing protein